MKSKSKINPILACVVLCLVWQEEQEKNWSESKENASRRLRVVLATKNVNNAQQPAVGANISKTNQLKRTIQSSRGAKYICMQSGDELNDSFSPENKTSVVFFERRLVDPYRVTTGPIPYPTFFSRIPYKHDSVNHEWMVADIPSRKSMKRKSLTRYCCWSFIAPVAQQAAACTDQNNVGHQPLLIHCNFFGWYFVLPHHFHGKVFTLTVPKCEEKSTIAITTKPVWYRVTWWRQVLPYHLPLLLIWFHTHQKVVINKVWPVVTIPYYP